jgi:Domain of unknown function (DUF4386)
MSSSGAVAGERSLGNWGRFFGEAKSRKRAARLAGLVYLLMVVPGPFVLLYIPNKIIVSGNASATTRNILAHEGLFRIGIAGEIFFHTAFLLVPLMLYRLLKEVDKRQAVLMVTLYALSVPIVCLNAINSLMALTLVRGTGWGADWLSVFNQPQREALAMVFVRLHGQGFLAGEVFWGLWLLPFGWLVWKSGFLPRVLGVLLVIDGIAWVAEVWTTIVWPAYADGVSEVTSVPKLAEILVLFWLLVVGAREGTKEAMANLDPQASA